MKATILVDNIAQENLKQEWGLSILIEYQDRTVLLDTGGSAKFAENAKKLGKDLSKVEYGVLSHAHYDHSDGMSAFFQRKAKANFYLRETAASFPGKKIHAIVGGFHLCNASEKEVRALAADIRSTKIDKVYTGHCTGDKAYRILEEELGEDLSQLKAGMVITF